MNAPQKIVFAAGIVSTLGVDAMLSSKFGESRGIEAQYARDQSSIVEFVNINPTADGNVSDYNVRIQTRDGQVYNCGVNHNTLPSLAPCSQFFAPANFMGYGSQDAGDRGIFIQIKPENFK